MGIRATAKSALNKVLANCVVVFLLFVNSLPAPGQTQNATIKGVITDTTGSRIVQAVVTATNQRTTVSREVLTNDAGEYVVTNLSPGAYWVEATKDGFQKGMSQGLTLNVNQTLTLDIQLRVGAVNEVINVVAEGTALESATAQLGTVITEEKILDLPLNTRNFTQLVTLTPGAIPVSVAENRSNPLYVARVGTAYFPAINGQSNRSNTYTLDGIYNNGNYGSTYAVAPNIDGLSEFKVQAHSDQAEFGGVTGGVINLVSKSGTNEFHGTLYEFLRNDALDARGFFTARKPPLRQNQFGATLGGPVIRNRTFFFASYEGYREVNPSSSLTRVPTAKQLGGDFSGESRPIFDPFTTRTDPENANRLLRDPIPNNIIPASMLNPSMQAWAKAVIPAPINTGFEGFNQRNDDPQTFPFNQYSVRGDHQFSQSDFIWARYTYGKQDQRTTAALPGTYATTRLPSVNFGLSYTHIFGSNTLINSLFGYSTLRHTGTRFVTNEELIERGLFPGLPVTTELNAPGVNLPSAWGGLPTDNRDRGPQEGYQMRADVSHTVNNHTFKFGGGALMLLNHTKESDGSMSFTTAQSADLNNLGRTGSDIASFVLGVVDSWLYRTRTYDFKGQVWDLYVQDSWRLTGKLTLNYGLRWDLARYPAFSTSFPSMWDFNAGKYLVGSTRSPVCSATQPAPCLSDPNDPFLHKYVVFTGSSKIREDDYRMFGPRFGFAWRARPTMVVRGSYGIFFDVLPGITQRAESPIGNWPNTTLLNVSVNRTFVTSTADNLFGGQDPTVPPPNPLQSYNFYHDPRMRSPYSEQWHLEIQKELPGSTQLTLGYVGSHNLRLAIGNDYNTAMTPGPGNPQLRALFPDLPVSLYDRSIGQSSYNGLLVKLEKRLSSDFSYLISYTWSKSIDVASSGLFGVESGSLQDPYNPNESKSVSGFDIPHYFSAAVVYRLPLGPGGRVLREGIASRVVGSWQINAITQLRSGQPYTFSTNLDIANIGARSNRTRVRPDLIGNPHLDNPTPAAWFNTMAYAVPRQYTFGSSGRNQLRSDGYQVVDLSLYREDSLTERLRMQFRAECFNIFNHPAFGLPQTLITDPNFGKVSDTTSKARQIQLALKFIF
jgi:outer membrane receptor protein involved in Fe transport